MKEIFMDYANATPVDERVFDAMRPYFIEKFGNPSSHIIKVGNEAVRALDDARKVVANFINAMPEEITFCASATESNNLALKGVAFSNIYKGNHLIISNIEHFSITSPTSTLVNKFGFKASFVDVDSDGFVDETQLRSLLSPETRLVSIQLANNEIGVIQNIKDLVKIVKSYNDKIIFHTDATAAAGLTNIDVKELGVDLLTFSATSLYGPKGAAALYVKNGVFISPLIEGGFQEKGLRSGTENMPAIIGFAKACELAGIEMQERIEHLKKLRDRLQKGLEEKIDFLHFTGSLKSRLPNNLSFWIEFAEGESLLLMLNYMGVMVSSGSACSSNLRAHDEEELIASPVLKAIGVPSDICTGSLTFSLGVKNTQEEIDYVLEIFPGIVQRLWQMSPFYLDKIKGHTPKMTKIDK